MDAFPENAHELAKEIAAFATSNTGTIYIGINKHKITVGISTVNDIGDTNGKDDILNRLAGIAYKSVQPSISVDPFFICYENKVILRIDISKGIEPVYYSKNVPYLRILTTSTPAAPNRVKELHKQYFLEQGFFKGDFPYLEFVLKEWDRHTENIRHGIYIRNTGKKTAVYYTFIINGVSREAPHALLPGPKLLPITPIENDELKNGVKITGISWKDTHGNEREQEDVFLRHPIFYDIYNDTK